MNAFSYFLQSKKISINIRTYYCTNGKYITPAAASIRQPRKKARNAINEKPNHTKLDLLIKKEKFEASQNPS